jgi:quinol monooxygenase YgiN
MILVITRIKVLPEKRLELIQKFDAMIESISMEKGCRHCEFIQSVEDGNSLFLLEEWDTQENLMAYEKSEHFKVLRGELNILTEFYERTFNNEFHPKTMEKILALLRSLP